jgi:two-component system NarL family response regulator
LQPRFTATRNLDRTFTKYHLSERETTVLGLLAKGLTDRDIANALQVTAFTVNKHVGAILLKMNVRSRTAAAVHAIREHLVDETATPRPLQLTG